MCASAYPMNSNSLIQKPHCFEHLSLQRTCTRYERPLVRWVSGRIKPLGVFSSLSWSHVIRYHPSLAHHSGLVRFLGNGSEHGLIRSDWHGPVWSQVGLRLAIRLDLARNKTWSIRAFPLPIWPGTKPEHHRSGTEPGRRPGSSGHSILAWIGYGPGTNTGTAEQGLKGPLGNRSPE